MILLELSHLSKSFMGPSGAVHAVEDVTLTVEAGEFVAVRGSSGCGKTTLIREVCLPYMNMVGGFYTEELREGASRAGFM